MRLHDLLEKYLNSLEVAVAKLPAYAPHFPALPTFPHHKHTRDTVIAHNKPNLLDVLQEAAGWV